MDPPPRAALRREDNDIFAMLRGEAPDKALEEPSIPVSNIGNFIVWHQGRGGSLQDLRLPFPPEEYSGKRRESWLSYREHVAFQKSIIDRVEGFTLPDYFDMGNSALKNRLLKAYRAMAVLISPANFLPMIIRFAGTLQNYTAISLMEHRPGFARVRYDVDPAINRYALGGLVYNVTGFIAAALSFRFGAAVSYKAIRTQNRLENAALAAYERYALDLELRGEELWADGRLLAERVPEPGTDGTCLRVAGDFRKRGLLLFPKGILYDASFCEVELSWEERLPLAARLRLRAARLKDRGRYYEELEIQLRTAQENYLDAERARKEAQRLARELEEKNRALSLLTDELERKVHERTAELESANERLRYMDMVKSKLLATVSHELRTPIALVSGPLERALRGEYGTSLPSDSPVLAAMARQTSRLRELLDSILDFTTLEFSRGSVRLVSADLETILRPVYEDFRQEAKERGIKFGFPRASLGLLAACEPRLLKTAVSNLISNALKYTPSGGSVCLEVKTDGDDFLISISDTGIGFSPEEAERLFDRLYRSARSRESDGDTGRGLGLAIAREIAECHRGSIRAFPGLDRGARFEIRLPRLANAGNPLSDAESDPGHPWVADRDQPARAEAAALDEDRLLYVEDNPELSAFLAEGLSSICRVATALDAEQALAQLAVQGYDLVLSDIMMPGRDGLDFFREAKRRLGKGCPPFIFLTAKADEELKLSALDEGALDYIRKPFDELELRKKVASLLAFNRALRASDRRPAGAELRESLQQAFERQGLTKREREVADAICRGLSKKEISAELGIALATVKRHVESCYSKLGVNDRLQLLSAYIE